MFMPVIWQNTIFSQTHVQNDVPKFGYLRQDELYANDNLTCITIQLT